MQWTVFDAIFVEEVIRDVTWRYVTRWWLVSFPDSVFFISIVWDRAVVLSLCMLQISPLYAADGSTILSRGLRSMIASG